MGMNKNISHANNQYMSKGPNKKKKLRAKLGPMRDNLGPRDLQSVPLKPGWREY
jgi:hypothetical protein